MRKLGGVEGPPHGKSQALALTETCRHQNQAISEQVYTTLDSSPLENNEELWGQMEGEKKEEISFVSN